MKTNSFACAALALTFATLAGCATVPSVQAPSLRSIYEIRAAYDIVLTAEVAYRHLPRCAVGVAFTVAAPCHDRVIFTRVLAADRQVKDALDALEAFTRAHPGDLGINGLYQAATLAITRATALIAPFRV